MDEDDTEQDIATIPVTMSTPVNEQENMEYKANNMLCIMEKLFDDYEELENLIIDDGYIAEYCNILINDREIEKDYNNIEEIKLSDGDDVSIIASISGGST